MPKVRKGRSRIALLASVAMIATLFVIPASPASAGADVGDVEHPASWSACVGDATADAGFGDTAGSFADAAIDCIAYYGVTQGTSAGVYSPADGVTREQMALFLIRAAGPAGITVPAATDQGLTDIAGLPQASQDAINQLVDLGISQGVGNNEYGPADIVSRYQMALFLIRFLEVQNGTADLAASSALAGFTDTSQVSVEAYNAIETAYDHGITTGTTATTFSPFDAVTREQMAAFISRTLAHTNAAPAGVTLQASDTTGDGPFDPDLRMTVRDDSFQPVPFALVDTFWVDDQDDNPPLETDGTCDAALLAGGTGTDCVIDGGDTEVDADGNAETDLSTLTLGTVAADEVWTLWSWTGDLTDSFDLDTTDVSAVTLTGTTAPVVETTVSDDLATGATLVAFGDSVTVTFESVDTANDDAPVAGVEIDVVWNETVAVDGSTTSTATGKTATVTTDSSGMATFVITASDPEADDTGDVDPDTHVFNITSIASADSDSIVDDTSEPYTFSDADSEATNYTVSSPEYVNNTSTAASALVTVTVTDQYGDGVAGETGTITATAGLMTVDASTTRVTNSNGVASYTFTAASAGSLPTVTFTETFSGSSNTDTTWFAAQLGDGVTQADGATTDVTLGVVDADNDIAVWVYDPDTGVADDEGAYWAPYDSGDSFREDTLGGAPITLADFEDATALISVTYVEDGISTFVADTTP